MCKQSSPKHYDSHYNFCGCTFSYNILFFDHCLTIVKTWQQSYCLTEYGIKIMSILLVQLEIGAFIIV